MKNYDHIIIGGGILGLSIAYHLARDSRDSVVVLERNELASAASSRAAGLVLQVTTKPSQTAMTKRTCETIPLLERGEHRAIGRLDDPNQVLSAPKLNTGDDEEERRQREGAVDEGGRAE